MRRKGGIKGPDDPLRVGLLISHFYPQQSGAERQALEQGAELARLGHSVHVLTKRVEGLPRDEVHRGISIHRWIKTSSYGPLFGLSFVAGVARGLRKLRHEIDLIHAHQALWEGIAAGAARPGLGGLPTLIQPASTGYYGEAEELGRTRGRSLLRRVLLNNTAFAAISSDVAEQWTRLGVPPERLHRTASGVDVERFAPGPSRVEKTLPPRPRVVFTGRLHPQKGLETLLEAWPAVAAETGASLVLVGDGIERDRLESKAEDLNIRDRIRFVGEVPDPAEYLRAADAFALPSVAEGMSNSLLEAMATALPCYVSKIGGNVDLIADGVNGRLLPPADPKAWSDALIADLAAAESLRAMGVEARKRVEERHSIRAVVGRNLEIYRHLLGIESGPSD